MASRRPPWFLGLALLSKYSALLWLPLFVLVAVPGTPPRTLTRRLAGVFGIAMLVLLVGYGLQIGEFGRGLQAQLGLVSSGWEPSFLNGEISHEGWWHYYLFALLVKLPLPTLLLLGARALPRPRAPGAGWRDTLFLLAPVAVFLGGFSLLATVNNGLRYVLPILPFLLVWIGGLVTARLLVGARRATKDRRIVLVADALAGSYGTRPAASPSIPHYARPLQRARRGSGERLPPPAGLEPRLGAGPAGTRGLAGRARPGEQVKLCYFGTADPAQHGIDVPARSPAAASGPGRLPARELREGDLVAISATNLWPLFADLGDLSRPLPQPASPSRGSATPSISIAPTSTRRLVPRR